MDDIKKDKNMKTIKIEVVEHVTDMALAFRGLHDNVIEEDDKRFVVFENIKSSEYDMLTWYWYEEISNL